MLENFSSVLYCTHCKAEISEIIQFYCVHVVRLSFSVQTNCYYITYIYRQDTSVHTVYISDDVTTKRPRRLVAPCVNDRAHRKSTLPPSGLHYINFNNEFPNGLMSQFIELFLLFYIFIAYFMFNFL